MSEPSTVRSQPKSWKEHLMEEDDDAYSYNNNSYDPEGSQITADPTDVTLDRKSNGSRRAEDDKLKRYSDQIEAIEASINKLNEGFNRLTVNDRRREIAQDSDDEEDDYAPDLSLEDQKEKEETLFFLRPGNELRIDYVLSYSVPDKIDRNEQQKEIYRKTYIKKLKKAGLKVEISVDKNKRYVKLNATWGALLRTAELLNMKKRLKMERYEKEEEACQIHCECCACLYVGEPYVTSEEDYFTATFTEDTMRLFDIEAKNEESFFTNSERSLIVKEILDRTAFSVQDPSKYGIHKLLDKAIFSAAYPLHEGPYKSDQDEDAFNGIDKDRQRLFEAWAKPGRWAHFQPLDLIRKYFGEKIGIYFAWLGFYTMMLIPASVVGFVVFIYGIATVWSDVPSEDICASDAAGDYNMCPQCDLRCDYWKLEDSCIYSRITYVFDNAGTVGFACFMAVWAMFFLEFWKRQQKTLEYDWDVSNFELEERVRPQFDNSQKVKKRFNPITQIKEPYLPWYVAIPRSMTSILTILFFIILVLAAIFGIIIYRVIIVALLYYSDEQSIHSIAKIITSLSAAIINFIVIIILNIIYTKVAHFLTEFECPRTDTEFEDSFTFKMFLFQFVNFYGTIFYIAFFKGSFSSIPGDKSSYFFGKWRPDECDPSGCIVDLFLQLAIIMTGKQVINNVKEILMPKLLTWWRSRDNKKDEDNVYMRWEKDEDLEPLSPLGLFDEYLEMVIQYGFVTLFVAAFPLAPLLALLNNIIEIRLDAYKFVCVTQRPPATKAQDIGVWYDILEGISFIGVLSNACIIGWTSEFIPKLVWRFGYTDNMSLDGYIDASLATFRTLDYQNDTDVGPSEEIQAANNQSFCRYRGYYTSYDDPAGAYEYTLQYWHILAARLAFVVCFEHAVFLMTWFVAFLIPDVPSSVKQLMLYESALVKKARFDAAQVLQDEENTNGSVRRRTDRNSSVPSY